MNSHISIVSLRSALFAALIALVGGSTHAAVTGFNGGTGWQANSSGSGPATFSGQQLTITTVNNGTTNSAFFKTPQPDSSFTASFTYTDAANSTRGGDGATFVLQNDPRGASALASGGGSTLGYGATGNDITNSVAVEIHIDSAFSPPIGVALGVNGTVGPYVTPGSVSLYGGDPINVLLSYNGTTLSEQLLDTVSNATYSTSYNVNIPGTVGSLAYVGFTGGSGLDTSTQQITNFSYATPEPTSWVMFALGGLGLWLVVRRRRIARAVCSPALVLPVLVLVALTSSTVRADISGFNGGTGWQTTANNGTNGLASFSGQGVTITTLNATETANSAIYKTEQPTSHFTAAFTYTDAANSSRGGDGATFVLENDPRGASAVGGTGSDLGYGGQITQSVAFEMHIDSLFSPPIGVGLGVNGSTGTYATTGSVNLYSGDPINVVLNYSGTTLNASLTDAITHASYSTSYAVNIGSDVGSMAYVGFTGGEGIDTATQQFSNFTFATPEPTSWVMFAFGGLGLWLVVRRRRAMHLA